MPNPYRDEWERFASKGAMKAAIVRQLDAGNFDKALELTAALKEAENAGAWKKEREELAASVHAPNPAQGWREKLSTASLQELQEEFSENGFTFSAVRFVLDNNRTLPADDRRALVAEYGSSPELAEVAAANPKKMWANHKVAMMNMIDALSENGNKGDLPELDRLVGAAGSAAETQSDVEYALHSIPYEYEHSTAYQGLASNPALSNNQAVYLLRQTLTRHLNPAAALDASYRVEQTLSKRDASYTSSWSAELSDAPYPPYGTEPSLEDVERVLEEENAAVKSAEYMAALVRVDATKFGQDGLKQELGLAEKVWKDEKKAEELRGRMLDASRYLHAHQQIDSIAAKLGVENV